MSLSTRIPIVAMILACYAPELLANASASAAEKLVLEKAGAERTLPERMLGASAEALIEHLIDNPQKVAAIKDMHLALVRFPGGTYYYRIGRSWSADSSPPPDFDKFANIVKHVAMHYNGGWANGFRYKIRYWEFWNEPDVKEAWGPGKIRPFWTGTPEQFYQLYEKVARVLKAYDPALKVGAPAQAAGGYKSPYREGLIAIVPPNGCRWTSSVGTAIRIRATIRTTSRGSEERFAACWTPPAFATPRSLSTNGI